MSNPTATVADSLQEGIYFRSGETPAACYRLLLLDFAGGIGPAEARDSLAAVWGMLRELQSGRVGALRPERPDDPDFAVPAGGLTCLLGYGARLFNAAAHTPPLVTVARPSRLIALPFGQPGQPFLQLHWHAGVDRNRGEADIALQFIAETELAANRAIVEVRKLIAAQHLPLRIVIFFAGFKREDRRSWIDFHDGINTMTAPHRLEAMEIKLTNPPWLTHGTYMNFLKVAVDLDVWNGLTRVEQEVIVGRDKLTGCPIERVDDGPNGDLVPRVIAECPMTGMFPQNPPLRYLDPGRATTRLPQASHIHRANLNRSEPRQPASNRLYRQGYEFLDPLPDGDIRPGLNFVSFQRDLGFVQDILRRGSWLGDVNFGGPVNPQPGEPAPVVLMSLVAGGFYAVPPRDEPFPGAALFDGGP
jgi:deferrochelatase/peroxidase EfeB